ncbi:MAG: hypothetical protein K2X66_14505 [Cyanobacteria bacterium]|nr:hypothetical protein [Cyanobacteriota bacterium]
MSEEQEQVNITIVSIDAVMPDSNDPNPSAFTNPTAVSLTVDLLDSLEYERLLETFDKVREYLPELSAQGVAIVLNEKEEMLFHTVDKLQSYVEERGKKGLTLQRFKGLGEMMPQQLWDTTMNPETRTLLRVEIEEAVIADKLFDILMGERVEPRRNFIESNAHSVKNLDI